MFYSVCEEEEWSVDHYDYARDQHYTEDGVFLSPCIGAELMSRVGKLIFDDISSYYNDKDVIKFIDKVVVSMNIERPTEDEFRNFCALVKSVYHERTIEEFNTALSEFISDCTYSEWNDIYSGNDLYIDTELNQPEGWEDR